MASCRIQQSKKKARRSMNLIGAVGNFGVVTSQVTNRTVLRDRLFLLIN